MVFFQLKFIWDYPLLVKNLVWIELISNGVVLRYKNLQYTKVVYLNIDIENVLLINWIIISTVRIKFFQTEIFRTVILFEISRIGFDIAIPNSEFSYSSRRILIRISCLINELNRSNYYLNNIFLDFKSTITLVLSRLVAMSLALIFCEK